MTLTELPCLTDKACFEQALNGALPSLRPWRHKAWAAFEQMPWPGPKHEAWRFSGMAAHRPDAYLPWMGAALGARDPVQGASTLPAGTAILGQDVCHGVSFLSPKARTQGVQALSVAEALDQDTPLRAGLLQHLGGILGGPGASGWPLGGQKWLCLALSYLGLGLVIDVPAGVVLEEPLSLAYALGPLGTVTFPLVYVRLGQGARATLVEYTLEGSAPLGPDLGLQASTLPRCIVSASYTDLAAGASLKRFCVHTGMPHARAYTFEKTVLQAQAQFTQVALHGGMDQARCESQVVLQGQGSQARLYSASLLRAQQQLDQRTLQVHEAPGASSDLLYKNVLLDEAKSVFSGLIQVGPQGQKTDAYQKNRNLLLSPQAQSHALPGLEILANDVKCSHGATSSALDPNELFYMVSRGIPQAKAMEMLALGFLEEALAHIDEPACLEYVQRLLHAG